MSHFRSQRQRIDSAKFNVAPQRESRFPDEVFSCEEGDSGSPVPMPGQIAPSPERGRASSKQQTPAAVCPEWLMERRSERMLPEDNDALQLPGLLVSGPVGMADNSAPFSDNSQLTGCLRGLCATCELRDTCTFPRPEGGVWRCEEYR